jgi:hypothetical protein
MIRPHPEPPRPRLTLVRADAPADDARVLPFPRPLGILRGHLALPCRAVRDGWLLPDDGPEAA